MLYINSQKEDRNTYSIEKYDFESDRQWTIYRGNLEKLGYFKQELQGSKLHITLLGIAKQNYLDNLKYDFPNPANVIDSILTRDSLPIESIVSVVEDSSVDWMKDAIEEEEHELNEDDFGLNEKEDENEESLMDSHSLSNEEKSDLVELGKIVNGFKAFVDKESDIIDGVSFPGYHYSFLY